MYAEDFVDHIWPINWLLKSCWPKNRVLRNRRHLGISKGAILVPRILNLVTQSLFPWTLIRSQMSKQSPNLQKLKAIHHQTRSEGLLAIAVRASDTHGLELPEVSITSVPKSDTNCANSGTLLQKAEEFCRNTRVVANKSKVFVGNVSYRVKSRELKEFFSSFGKVIYAQIITDRIKKRSRGWV